MHAVDYRDLRKIHVKKKKGGQKNKNEIFEVNGNRVKLILKITNMHSSSFED